MVTRVSQAEQVQSQVQASHVPLCPVYSLVIGGALSAFPIIDALLFCGFRTDHNDALRLLLSKLSDVNPCGSDCFLATLSRFHCSMGLSTNESTIWDTTSVDLFAPLLPPPPSYEADEKDRELW